MKFGSELAERAIGENWQNVIPETDIDKDVMTRIFMDVLYAFPDHDHYYFGVHKSGVDSDGSLSILIARKDDESFRIYDGTMTLLGQSNNYDVIIDFVSGAEDILPAGMERRMVCEYMCSASQELPDADMAEGYQNAMKMIERAYLDKDD